MEREKLNEAALTNTEATADLIADSRHLAVNSFIQGAEWLMLQPLAERLSEEERENYRCIYSTAKKMIDEVKFVNPQLVDVFNGQLMMLKSIFGKEVFEQ